MTPRLGLIGYAGRMGQAVARVIQERTDACLVGGVARTLPSPAPNNADFLLTDDADKLFPLCDILIDFSSPQATPAYARLAAHHGKAFMSGVTGLDDAAHKTLQEAAQKVPVLYAANTSLSLVVMRRLVALAAQLLRDRDYDIAILDRHHRWKKDAPSGTAKTLGEAVLSGNKGSHPPQFAAVRAGAIVGEHEVSFTGQGESLTLLHTVTDRMIFARGAVDAALWLQGRPAGLYGMDDVVGTGAG